MTILTIDPGLVAAGLAVFEDSTLEWSGFAKPKEPDRWASGWLGIAREVGAYLELLAPEDGFDEVVYETARVYRKGKGGRQSDVLQLMGSLGAIVGLSPGLPADASCYTGYEPGSWTSGRPKEPNQRRIWRRLEADEKDSFDGVSSARLASDLCGDTYSVGDYEHALDAVGVGLYHFRRL